MINLQVVCACLLLMSSVVAPVGAADTDLLISVPGVLPKGNLDLGLAIRSNDVAAAFVIPDGYNDRPGEMDVSGLAVADGRVRGPVRVVFKSDGWVPAWGANITAAFDLDANLAGGDVRVIQGSATRAATLVAHPVEPSVPASTGSVRRLTLHLRNALPDPPEMKRDEKACWAARPPRLDVWLDSAGNIVGALADPPGSVTDTGCDLTVVAASGRVMRSRLTGRVEISYTHQSGTGGPLVWEFDAPIIAGRVAGSVTTDWNGRSRGGTVLGACQPEGTWVDGRATVFAHGVLGPMGYLQITFVRRQGRFIGAIATTPDSRNSVHTVTAVDLVEHEGRVKGRIQVVVHPDPWVPKDRQDVPLDLRVDAVLDGGRIAGRHQGTAKGLAVAGVLDGRIDPPEEVTAITRVVFKLEAGLPADTEYHGRVFVSGRVVDGRLVDGTLSNNHYKEMTGTATGLVTLAGSNLAIDAELTVPEGLKVRAGKYRVVTGGDLVGRMAGGPFTVTCPAGAQRQGTAWITVTP